MHWEKGHRIPCLQGCHVARSLLQLHLPIQFIHRRHVASEQSKLCFCITYIVCVCLGVTVGDIWPSFVSSFLSFTCPYSTVTSFCLVISAVGGLPLPFCWRWACVSDHKVGSTSPVSIGSSALEWSVERQGVPPLKMWVVGMTRHHVDRGQVVHLFK